MILYFDNLIIDSPLRHPGFYHGLDAIRASRSNYRDQSRLRISMYTLASYAVLAWDGVLIRYECADAGQDEVFEEYVRTLFPAAVVVKGRSDSQEKFKESLAILDAMPSDWVFVAGNNDHPIIAAMPDPLNLCLEEGEALCKTHEFVSIPYSHLAELKSAVDPRYTIAWHGGLNWTKLADTDEYLVAKGKVGAVQAIQVMHKRMLRRLVTGMDYGDKLIRRTDDMDARLIRNHVMVISKRVIGDHYDGYAHEKLVGHYLPYETYPPLFIPPGFFEGEIRVAYGFAETRAAWVNVNPSAKTYSFQDPTRGTDLKCSIDRLPGFWRSRTKEIDVNPDADRRVLHIDSVLAFKRMSYPWPKVPAVVSLSIVSVYRLPSYLHRLVARYAPSLLSVYRMLKRGLMGKTPG